MGTNMKVEIMNLPAVFINGRRVLQGQGADREEAEALFRRQPGSDILSPSA